MEEANLIEDLKKNNIDEKIYEEKMNEIIQKTIPNINFEEEDKEEMARNLEKILREACKHSVIYEIKMPNIGILEMVIEETIESWNKKSPEEKKQILVFDEGFEKIYSASMRAYKMAQDRVNNGIIANDENQYNELKAKLETGEVKDFNQYRVKEIKSEGLLDLMYAFGKSEAMSLRVGRYQIGR